MLKVVSAGLSEVGSVGGECKEWIWHLVNNAYSLQLPQNDLDALYQWKPITDDRVVRTGAPIEAAMPGDIVQMIISGGGGYTQHTAIVGSNNGGSIVWIESNYNHDFVVRFGRTQTHAQFHASLSPAKKYTIYRLRGI